MDAFLPVYSAMLYSGGMPGTSEHAQMASMLRAEAVLAPPSALDLAKIRDRKGLLEKLKTKWNNPKVRTTVGNLAYVAAAILAVAAVAALTIHFTTGGVGGFDISLTYAAMAASFAALAVLKGLQFREEAKLMHEQEIAEEDAKIEWLQKKITALQKQLEIYGDEAVDPLLQQIDALQTSRQEQIEKQRRNESIQKAVGAAIMVIALSLLLIQLLGLNNQTFRSIFHTTIPNSLLTIGTVFAYAIGIAYTGIALITNAMEHRQDIRGATLENERRALELKLRYHTQE